MFSSSKRKSSNKDKKKSRHPDDHHDRRRSTEPQFVEAGPSSQGRKQQLVDFSCESPGCGVFNASNIHLKWPRLDHLPRPEPDPNSHGPHRKWLEEYDEWKDLKCGGGKGYFCRSHGMWITCAEINTNRALSKEYEQHNSCPAHHYARDNAIAQSAPSPDPDPAPDFDQVSGNPTLGYDEETELPVNEDVPPFANLGDHLDDLSLQDITTPRNDQKYGKNEPYFGFGSSGHGIQAQGGNVPNADDNSYWEPHNQPESTQHMFQQTNEEEIHGNRPNRIGKAQGKSVSQGRAQDYPQVPSEVERWPATSPHQRMRSPDPLYSQDAGTIGPTPPTPIREFDETKDYYNPYDTYPSSTSGVQPRYGSATHHMENPGSQFYGQDESYDQEYIETGSRGQQRQRRKHQR